MEAFEFLSPEWIAAARALREEYRDRLSSAAGGDGSGPGSGSDGDGSDPGGPGSGAGMVANIVVTGAPFDRTRIEGHVDTTALAATGAPVIDEGHRGDADLTMELPYDLARGIFCQRDPQAFFEAVFAGRVKVTGDSSKLLLLPIPSAAEPHPLAAELARRLDEITR